MTKRSIFSRKALCAIATSLTITFSVVGNVAAQESGTSPGDLEELFQTAMTNREAGRHYEAIKGFQTILSNQPTLQRARLELAVAYYQTYKFQEALTEAKQVLDDPETPPKVKVAILAFIAQIEKGQKGGIKTNQFRFPVSVGYLFDSNVGRLSDELNVSSTSTVSKESGSAKIISAGLNHNYVARYNRNPGGKDLSVFLQSGVNIYHRGYFDVDNEDLNVVSFWTGPTIMSGKNWRFNFNLQEDIIDYADVSYANFHSLTPTFVATLPLDYELTIDASYSSRDFKRSLDEGRDSDYSSFGGAMGHTCMDGKISAQAGGQYFHEGADDGKYSNDGSKLFAGVTYSPVKALSLSIKYDQIDYNYDLIDALSDLSARDEREANYTFAISYAFDGVQFLDGWTLEGKLVDTAYDSNVARYEYDRTQTYVTFRRVF